MPIKHMLRSLSLCLLLFSCDEKAVEAPQDEAYELNAPTYFGSFNERIPDDNPITKKGVALGRMLFYENKLSGDNSMSCGSCHQQSKAFTDGKKVSPGIDGISGEVSSMSLVNMLWTEHFTWDGSVPTLEAQSIEPIVNPIELHQSLDAAAEKLEAAGYNDLFVEAFGEPVISGELIGKALAQFQRTLISGNSPYDQYLRGDYQPSQQELRGMNLFFTHPIPGQLRGGNCGDCHSNFLTSGSIPGFTGFHNNGLDAADEMKAGLFKVTGNPADSGRFKTPSLRNIALTAPYMHDGRFETLEQVLDHYNEGITRSPTLDILIIEGSNNVIEAGDPIELGLTPEEKEDIIAFLNILTDEEFVTNPQFSNPFKEE